MAAAPIRGHNVGMRRAGVLSLCALMLAGCATIVPEDLQGRVNREVSAQELLAAPERYLGQVVMLGGDIVQVRTTGAESEVVVLERPLAREEPLFTDRSAGRFLIQHAGLLDPAQYAVGRRVTAVGTVVEPVTRQDGQHTSRYAVVDARVLKLWPPVVAAQSPYAYYPYADPFWYDPWFRYPYWYRHPRFYRR